MHRRGRQGASPRREMGTLEELPNNEAGAPMIGKLALALALAVATTTARAAVMAITKSRLGAQMVSGFTVAARGLSHRSLA